MSAKRGSGRPKLGYKLEGGKRVPSVTQITGRFKDAGGLIVWAHRMGLEGKSMSEARDSAATAGTLCHAMIEAHLHARPYTPMAEDETLIVKARTGFESFLKWYGQTMVTIDHSETPLVSEKHQYGGTPDAIGKINGERVLLDWKSSNGVYSDYLCQCAAYVMLWEEANPEDPITSMHLLRVDKNFASFVHHQWGREVIDHAATAFLHMRQLYELDALLKRAAA